MKSVIEIIVNKNWEAEPFLSAMTNIKLRPKELPFPQKINAPKDNKYRSTELRAEFDLKKTKVIVRCIEDLMDLSKNPSSSEEKYRVLPGFISSDKPDLIISVSTAESAPDIQPYKTESLNGSVIMGGTFHMFDARAFDPTTSSHLIINIPLIRSHIYKEIYDLIDNSFRATVERKFASAHRFPAKEMKCIANPDHASIGVVNVTDYKAYEKADPAAYENFIKRYSREGIAATIETTHGIVRMSADNRIPVLFVSPITDRYEHFADDATDTQNYIAAFNAGIAVGEFICRLDNYLGSNDILIENIRPD